MNVFAVIVALALCVQYRGGPTLSFAHPVTLLALVGALAGIVSLRVEGWRRAALAVVAGLFVGVVFFDSPPLAWSTFGLVVAMHGFAVALGGGRLRADVAVFAAIALVFAGAAHGLGGGLEITLFGWVFIVLKALVVALLVGDSEQQNRNTALGFVLLLVTLGLVVVRVVDVVGSLASPVEASWAEAPFLVDMLKLDAHEPLYGPLELVNSYTYSPLLALLHHAVLEPFHAELSLVANRALGLFALLAASVVFAWGAAPHVAEGLSRVFPSRGPMWGFAVALLVCFSSLLAGTIHPDHPSLLCIALAFALVVRERAWPRWLWWATLFVVTPVAVAFKLTGAGVGVGLFAVMVVERRVRECLVLGGSALVSFATIPLFDATCGAFSSYAIGMQRSHAMEWPRLLWPPTFHFAAATALALAMSIGVGSQARVTLRRIGLLFAGVVALMLPAYLKFAGRENNLLPLFVAGVLVVVVAALVEKPRRHPLLGHAVVLYLLMLVWTPHAKASVVPVPIATQMHEVDAVMTDDDKASERTLVPSAALWILHGRRDVPVDRTNSAYELSYGHHPQAELFFEHIEDGRYRSVVVWSGDLERAHAPGFVDRYTNALATRYDRIYPPSDVSIGSVVYVIYRRRP